MHIARGLEQNDGERYRHAGHPSEDGRGAHQGVRAAVGEGTAGMIELVQQMTKQPAKGRPGKERRDEQTAGNGDAVRDGCQRNVGEEEEK